MADPFSALADIVIGVYKERKLQQWVSLLFQIFISVLGTFFVTTGSSLIATLAVTKSIALAWTIAVANALMASAVVIGVYVRKSPLLKNMMFVFPTIEAQKELNTDIQIITRNK